MSKYSVKKPITVLMGILIVIVLGIFAVTQLPLTLFPDMELPYLVTVTTYEGGSPEELEREVSTKIETAVSTIGSFQEVSSMSNEHFAISIITFGDTVNMDSVTVELREMLNNIAFIEGVDTTQIMRISPDMLPIMTISMFRSYDESVTDEQQLILNTEWLNEGILNSLESVAGVASVEITGQADIVLEIDLDQTKLTTAGLTNEEVLTIIDNQNVGGLVGVALDSGEIRMLYLGDEVDLLTGLENLPIAFDGVDVVYLSDLVVTDGINFVNANMDTYSKINGKPGIQISFQKQANYSTTEVSSNILDKLNSIVEESEIDADYVILLNQGEYINQSVNSVLLNLVLGAIIAIFVLFLFLKDIKPTIIVGLAIPISVISAFMLMFFSNISLNIISMGGLALGIGMLVDNSVVVIENIFRMISEGKSRREASIEGAKQVAGAITASTLTTVAVFLPLIFVQGMIADMFMSMALTIAYSLGSSLIIALTMVPSMSSKFLNEEKQKKESKVILGIKKTYEKSINFALKNKIVTLVTVVVLLVVSTFAVVTQGFVLMPTSDEGSIELSIDVATQVEFDTKSEYADLITDELLELSDIETIATTIGGSNTMGGMSMMSSSSNTIVFTITLKDGRTSSTLQNIDFIESIMSEFDYSEVTDLEVNDIDEIAIEEASGQMGMPGASGVQIKLSGYDLETLEELANGISAVIEGVEGIDEVDNGIIKGADSVKITVNQDNAMFLELTSLDIQENLEYLYANLGLTSQSEEVNVRIEGINYVLSVPETTSIADIDFTAFGDYKNFFSGVNLFDEDTRTMIDSYMDTGESIYVINAMLPTYMLGDSIKFVVNPYLRITAGEIVMDQTGSDPTLLSLAKAPLFIDEDETSITTIEKISGFATINTDGSNRYLTISAEVEEGKNITLVSSDVTIAVNEYVDSESFTQYGSGYSVEFEGENEDIMESFGDLLIALVVAILLVYMVMAIQFQSLKYPFIILGTLPLAFTGGMLSLFITGTELSMVALMGFIILIGIVVNNGIVLIDYINKLREAGSTVIESIIKAGKTRLRPILMTSLTTIIALSTMAIGIGEGSEMLQPMAITAIGGLVYATILTLIVVPVIYAIFNRKQIKKEIKIQVK